MNRIYITLSVFLLLFTRCISPQPKETPLKDPSNVTKQLNANKPKESTLKVQVSVIDKLNSEYYKEMGGIFYTLNIDLINNTDSTIQIWMMSCSWMENMLSNTAKAHLLGCNCDKNCPELYKIKSGQAITYNGILRVKDTSVLKNHQEVKLGFVLIKEGETSGNGDFYRILSDKIKRKKDFIWSNTIVFKERKNPEEGKTRTILETPSTFITKYLKRTVLTKHQSL
jgi:hypothetical protein